MSKDATEISIILVINSLFLKRETIEVDVV